MKLYSELAKWWPLISPPQEYKEAAGRFASLLEKACRPKRVLELGSGGGHNAFHLKKRFDMTLVDISPEMLGVSRDLNPECAHYIGDMRKIRLGKTFDAVFIQDAICHMTTVADLEKALETAFLHCRPEGAVLVVPDHFRETFRPQTMTGGSNADDRSVRYLEWTYDPDPGDDTIETDLVFVLRENDFPVRVVHDHLTTGLFSRQVWLDAFGRAGLIPKVYSCRLTQPSPTEITPILGLKPK